MSNESQGQDPLEFVKSLWGGMGFSLPGMVAPTIDTDELAKRIADLKAVEGWLKMNLNMLQMSIQALEMQRATLSAMQAFAQPSEGGNDAAASLAGAALNPALNPALWPWNFMQASGAAPQDGTKGGAEKQEKSSAPRRKKKSP